MSILKEIQATVIKYADIIANVTKVDVEIVDKDLFRIAGTGIYRNAVNTSIAGEGFVYKTALKTGKAQVIEQPGHDKLCILCPKQLICVEKFEVCTPIRLEEDTIGVIGLICFTDRQKQHLQNDFNAFADFLDQMAEFISAKAGEVREKRRILKMTGLLKQVLENLDRGVLIIDGDQHIIQANTSAIHQLNLTENAGPILIEATGDALLGMEEFKVEIEGRRHLLMGNLIPVKNEELDCGKILMFNEIKKVKSGIYKITHGAQRITRKDILGQSQAIHHLKDRIVKVAQSSSSVLITGESGTGKELFARVIHGESDRWENPFVALNCGAIPDMLLESELFGYVKGAFTGADPRGRIGKFELAHKGVLFLDEIGDMPLYLQVKLLRVLQDKKITRIGSNQEIQLDIRVVAATNKDLPTMIREKKFREDLYYRLNVIPFTIPPLRSRPEDIPELVKRLVEKYSDLFQKSFRAVEPEVISLLQAYDWPGNVRELENTIEFMINMMNEDGILSQDTMPQLIIKKATDFHHHGFSIPAEVTTLSELEKRAIFQALSLYGRSTEGKKKAAKALGIGIATLYRKVEHYNLSE